MGRDNAWAWRSIHVSTRCGGRAGQARHGRRGPTALPGVAGAGVARADGARDRAERRRVRRSGRAGPVRAPRLRAGAGPAAAAGRVPGRGSRLRLAERTRMITRSAHVADEEPADNTQTRGAVATPRASPTPTTKRGRLRALYDWLLGDTQLPGA